jgi:hypothetical protein
MESQTPPTDDSNPRAKARIPNSRSVPMKSEEQRAVSLRDRRFAAPYADAEERRERV